MVPRAGGWLVLSAALAPSARAQAASDSAGLLDQIMSDFGLSDESPAAPAEPNHRDLQDGSTNRSGPANGSTNSTANSTANSIANSTAKSTSNSSSRSSADNASVNKSATNATAHVRKSKGSCSKSHEDCSRTGCCADSSLTCYEKNSHWSGCLESCVAGKVNDKDGSDHQTPWSCVVHGTTSASSKSCSTMHEDCSGTRCCSDLGYKCYQKNEHWAGCRTSCEPGIHEGDAHEHRTNWTCKELEPIKAPPHHAAPKIMDFRNDGSDGTSEASTTPSGDATTSNGDATTTEALASDARTASWCPASPEQLCRRLCAEPKCEEGRCAMRNGTCCEFSCVSQSASSRSPGEPEQSLSLGAASQDECVCTLDFKPVCGADGKTYSNACKADCEGVAVLARGPCDEATNRSSENAPVDSQNASSDEAGSFEGYDCQSGKSRWQWGWSDHKKEWCCKHERVGCVTSITLPPVHKTGSGSGPEFDFGTAPNPEAIKKMICLGANSQHLEDKMVNLVCDEIETAMPWTKEQFEPDCFTALEAAWDDITAECPKDEARPSNEDITRMMCNFAYADNFKGHAVREMCEVMERTFPWMKLEPNCHEVLLGMVDDNAHACANITGDWFTATETSTTTGTFTSTTTATETNTSTTTVTDTDTSTSSTTTPEPTPSPTVEPFTREMVQRLACAAATRKEIDGRHYGDICSRMLRRDPSAASRFPTGCLGELRDDWDALFDACPHGSETVAKSSYEREQLVCSFSSKRQIAGRKVREVCTQIGARLPWVSFKGGCHHALSDVWDDAAEKCPHGHEVMPSVEDLQKLACTFGTKRQIEASAFDEVCQRIALKLPWLQFAGGCRKDMKSVWPSVKQKCPLGSETVPVPEDYTKLVCSLATPEQIRGADSGGVCQVIRAKLPWLKFEPDCETVLDEGTIWYDARNRCPRGRKTVPSPYEIVKLICTAASSAQVASRDTHGVCAALHVQVPWVVEEFDPDCSAVLEAAWDQVLLKCPKGHETVPTGQELERLVCGMGSRVEMESRDAKTLCGKLDYHVPWMVIQPSCEHWLKSSFDELNEACPYGHDVILSSDALVNVICTVASKRQIQYAEGEATCAEIESKTPWFHFVPDCRTALAGVWEEAKAVCPDGNGVLRGMPLSALSV